MVFFVIDLIWEKLRMKPCDRRYGFGAQTVLALVAREPEARIVLYASSMVRNPSSRKGNTTMDPKSINSKIDAAASKGKSLVANASEKISDAAAKARNAAVAAQSKVEKIAKSGEHRLQETVLKAGHKAQEIASKLSHSAQETAQKVAHSVTEVASAAEHRSQEVAHNKVTKPSGQ